MYLVGVRRGEPPGDPIPTELLTPGPQDWRRDNKQWRETNEGFLEVKGATFFYGDLAPESGNVICLDLARLTDIL